MWVSEQSREDHLLQCGWASANLLGARGEQNRERRTDSLFLLELGPPSSPALRH